MYDYYADDDLDYCPRCDAYLAYDAYDDEFYCPKYYCGWTEFGYFGYTYY